MRILFCRTSIPETTNTAHGFFYEKALRKYHEVITYGPNLPEFMYKRLNFVQISKLVEADILYFTTELDDVLHRLPWTPDLLLWTDNFYWFLMRGLKNLPCPTACFLLDPQYLPELKSEMAKHFDHVFVSQKAEVGNYTHAGVQNAYWLTHACDPEVHGKKSVGKIHDICFVGNLDAKRIYLLNRLKGRFDVHYEQCFGSRMSEVYSQSKIIFNTSRVNEINMRIFEGMASGSMLLTDEAPGSGLSELFEDRKHLVFYRNNDELISLADYYLKNNEEREKISEAGMSEVLEKHTYDQRVEKMLQLILSSGYRRCHEARVVAEQTRKVDAGQQMNDLLEFIKEHPGNAEAHFNLGILLQGVARIEESIICYERAIQIKADDARVINNLGIAYKTMGDLERAVSHFQKAIVLKNDYVDAFYNLGNTFQCMMAFPQAIRCYEAVVRMDPGHAAAYNNMATAYLTIGQFDKHIEYFKKALHHME